jgi:hypothetical protein
MQHNHLLKTAQRPVQPDCIRTSHSLPALLHTQTFTQGPCLNLDGRHIEPQQPAHPLRVCLCSSKRMPQHAAHAAHLIRTATHTQTYAQIDSCLNPEHLNTSILSKTCSPSRICSSFPYSLLQCAPHPRCTATNPHTDNGLNPKPTQNLWHNPVALLTRLPHTLCHTHMHTDTRA